MSRRPLAGSRANDRTQLVEERLVVRSQVRERAAEDRRQVVAAEASAGYAQRVGELRIVLPQHEAGSIPLARVPAPHLVSGSSATAERPVPTLLKNSDKLSTRGCRLSISETIVEPHLPVLSTKTGGIDGRAAPLTTTTPTGPSACPGAGS